MGLGCQRAGCWAQPITELGTGRQHRSTPRHARPRKEPQLNLTCHGMGDDGDEQALVPHLDAHVRVLHADDHPLHLPGKHRPRSALRLVAGGPGTARCRAGSREAPWHPPHVGHPAASRGAGSAAAGCHQVTGEPRFWGASPAGAAALPGLGARHGAPVPTREVSPRGALPGASGAGSSAAGAAPRCPAGPVPVPGPLGAPPAVPRGAGAGSPC